MRLRIALACAAVCALACQKPGPNLAKLHVTCAANGQTLDAASTPPDNGQSCPAGSQVSLTYDNDGAYGYVTVFAVTRDSIVFYAPTEDTGESVQIDPNGHGATLPGTFLVPGKTRDIMALFSKQPLKAKDVAQHCRDVTLAQFTQGPNAATEVRVRLSGEYGPIN